MLHILIIHFRDRWIDIQKRELARFISEPYKVYSILGDGVKHGTTTVNLEGRALIYVRNDGSSTDPSLEIEAVVSNNKEQPAKGGIPDSVDESIVPSDVKPKLNDLKNFKI